MKPMTVRNYFRCSLALPIILPLVEALVHWCTGQSKNPFVSYDPFATFLGMSLYFGGIPYTIVAFIQIYRLRNKEDWEIHFLAVQAPLMMFVLQILYTLLFLGLQGDFAGGAFLACYTAIIALVLGYAYVIAVTIGLCFFGLLGWVAVTKTEGDAS